MVEDLRFVGVRVRFVLEEQVDPRVRFEGVGGDIGRGTHRARPGEEILHVVRRDPQIIRRHGTQLQEDGFNDGDASSLATCSVWHHQVKDG
ncbi:hypothetical protein [Rhodococcus sp. T2V]|uniref:hypothetical protein n=1 Tax=Rhodococcus sp. T2V TaxID=3034164 RepID=UPI0023E1CB86|nr:hypothetical protein [Rhodococcus sp. T2V]